jgi:hypothetical protein
MPEIWNNLKWATSAQVLENVAIGKEYDVANF